MNRPPAWQWTVSCPDGHDPTGPIDYGRCAVDQALAEVQTTRAIVIATVADPSVASVSPAVAPLLDGRAESYVVIPLANTTWVVGRDEIGAMYGALEIAERLRLYGAASVPPAVALRGTPAVPFRAANLFWTLKDEDEATWWFLDESFWRDYLDLLAHARLDTLDIHAMYDP